MDTAGAALVGHLWVTASSQEQGTATLVQQHLVRDPGAPGLLQETAAQGGNADGIVERAEADLSMGRHARLGFQGLH